jgi:putative salt-induced outer membrane protein YdiY/small nuclear ribonucleoprotein (snRNP)-like protein
MKRLLTCTVLLLALASQTPADQITLKNGDRVTGRIVKTDGGKLVVTTDLLGDVSVDLAAVTNITTDQPIYVTLEDGRTVFGTMTASADKVELRAANANVVSVDRAAIEVIRSEAEHVAYQSSLNPGLLEGWSGGADVGFALTSGNSDTINLAIGLSAERQTANDKTTIYAASIYNRDSTSGESHTIANTIRGGVRYDRDINRKFFGYGFTDLEHNGLQDLTLRFVAGGGIGYHAIRNERTQLDLLGGIDWNREYFKGDFNDRSTAEAQLGQTLSHRFSPRVSLKEQLFFFPNLTDGGTYRINFDAALVTDISRRIGWQLTLSDRYLSDPPPGLQQNDLLLTTGLKIRLGKMK